MAQNFLACDRDQSLFLPPDLRDWLDEDHLAWFLAIPAYRRHRRSACPGRFADVAQRYLSSPS
jgi:hypothetical protein